MTPELPLEVLSIIVDKFDAGKYEDRHTLYSLFFVCRKFYSLVLRSLYQDIWFSQDSGQPPFYDELASLARDAETNPGLKYTTSFSCISESSSGVWKEPDYLNAAIGDIFPFLVNIHRITLALDSWPIDATALQFLPLTAPLSHLKLLEWSLTSDSLQEFLASRPSLKYLHVNTFGDPSERSSLAAHALPHLLSLSIPASDMLLFEHPLPSLMHLHLYRLLTAQNKAALISRIKPFSSITACRLADVAFSDIAPIASSFPRLEYLSIKPLTSVRLVQASLHLS